MLSLVAFVRRLHEHRDSSSSGGLDACPQATTGADNRPNRAAAAAPYRSKGSGRSRK